MRIRKIIYESLKLPFKEYKSFLIVFLLLFLCDVMSSFLYYFHLGTFYLPLFIFKTVVTLILAGISMNIIENTIFDSSFHLHLKKQFILGIKEYILSIYYLIIPTILSIFFMLPTGMYSRILHIHEYILKLDMEATELAIRELLQQLPQTLQMGLTHSLQLNILIAIFLFVLFTSFSFIGRILLIKYDDLNISLDFRIINGIVQKIGYRRFIKFILVITVILILFVQVLVSLEIFFSDVVISSLFETFLLFFALNAFYRLFFEDDLDVLVIEDD